MPVDTHLIGLPSSPGNVLGTGSWISGTGPRSGPPRRPPRRPPAGAAGAAGVAIWALAAGVAGADESCAKSGAAEATTKPIKLTIINGGVFMGWMLMVPQQTG